MDVSEYGIKYRYGQYKQPSGIPGMLHKAVITDDHKDENGVGKAQQIPMAIGRKHTVKQRYDAKEQPSRMPCIVGDADVKIGHDY